MLSYIADVGVGISEELGGADNEPRRRGRCLVLSRLGLQSACSIAPAQQPASDRVTTKRRVTKKTIGAHIAWSLRDPSELTPQATN